MNSNATIPTASARTSVSRLESLKAATESLGFKDERVTMRLVREGKLKAVRVGNRVLITTKSLDAFAGC